MTFCATTLPAHVADGICQRNLLGADLDAVLGEAALLDAAVAGQRAEADISCEATLGGNLMYSRNDDVPGVIGFLGTCLGKNGVNVANFALRRQEESARKGSAPLTAISIIETDAPVPDSVISQLFENPAVKFARRVVS